MTSEPDDAPERTSSRPAIDEYGPLLEELLAFYPPGGARRLRDGYHGVGHIAHGWYQRCHRGVEAVLTLAAAGYTEEAAPLRRSIIEHVVALKWLAAEGDRITDTLQRGHARNTKLRRDAVAAAQWTSLDLTAYDEVIAELVDADRSHDHLLQFKARSEEFGSVHDLPGYLAETARAHPNYESATPYFDHQTGEALLGDPTGTVDQVGFCAQHLAEALIAMNAIFDPNPWTRELEDVVERIKTIDIAVRTERGMAIPDVYLTTDASADTAE